MESFVNNNKDKIRLFLQVCVVILCVLDLVVFIMGIVLDVSCKSIDVPTELDDLTLKRITEDGLGISSGVLGIVFCISGLFSFKFYEENIPRKKLLTVLFSLLFVSQMFTHVFLFYIGIELVNWGKVLDSFGDPTYLKNQHLSTGCGAFYIVVSVLVIGFLIVMALYINDFNFSLKLFFAGISLFDLFLVVLNIIEIVSSATFASILSLLIIGVHFVLICFNVFKEDCFKKNACFMYVFSFISFFLAGDYFISIFSYGLPYLKYQIFFVVWRYVHVFLLYGASCVFLMMYRCCWMRRHTGNAPAPNRREPPVEPGVAYPYTYPPGAYPYPPETYQYPPGERTRGGGGGGGKASACGPVAYPYPPEVYGYPYPPEVYGYPYPQSVALPPGAYPPGAYPPSTTTAAAHYYPDRKSVV